MATGDDRIGSGTFLAQKIRKGGLSFFDRARIFTFDRLGRCVESYGASRVMVNLQWNKGNGIMDVASLAASSTRSDGSLTYSLPTRSCYHERWHARAASLQVLR